MNCFDESEELKFQKSDCVALLGLLPDFDVEIVMCAESELPSDMDVIESYMSGNKSDLLKAYADLCKRKGLDFEIVRHNHEQRVQIAEDFLRDVNKIGYVSSVYLVGSVADGTDHNHSDVDIKIIRTHCPGEENCELSRLLKTEKYIAVDVYC